MLDTRGRFPVGQPAAYPLSSSGRSKRHYLVGNRTQITEPNTGIARFEYKTRGELMQGTGAVSRARPMVSLQRLRPGLRR